LIDNKKEEAQKTLDISKRYFTEGSPLKDELNLFSAVLSSKVNSKDTMLRIVDSACKSSANLNGSLIDEQKSKLIKDINHTLGQNVYEYKVSKYIDYSTLQALFTEARNKNKKLSEIDKIKLKDGLVQRLVENKKDKPVVFNKQYTNSLQTILVKKFHEKYNDTLTENQKSFLIQYTTSLMSENKSNFSSYLLKQKNEILKKINRKFRQSFIGR
jgi:hypothetical protein